MLNIPPHPISNFFSRKEWGIIGVCAVLIIGLGTAGYAALHPDASLSDQLYKTLGLFTLGFSAPTGNIPWQLDVARWLAPALLSYAAVKTILLMLRGQLLLLRIRRLQNHAVVCGLGEYGWPIVQALAAKQIPTVVIEPDPMHSHLGWADNAEVYVLPGNARDANNLVKVNVTQAKYLLAVTENDAANAEIIVQAFQLKQADSKSPLLKCIAHVQSHELAAVLYDDAVFSQDFAHFSARIINRQQLAARWLLLQHSPDTELIHDIPRLEEIRILLLGNHAFVEDLMVRLTKLGHYGTAHPVHITLAGPQAAIQLETINKRWPVLSEIISIKAKDIALSFLSAQNAQQLINSFKPHLIYLCAADTESTLIGAKALARLTLHCPVMVCQFADDLLTRSIEPAFQSHTLFKFVYPTREIFTMAAIFNATQDQLAIAIHNHYVESQIAAGDTAANNTSLVRWEDLPETLKDANRNQADHLQIKCRVITGSLHYTPEQIEHALSDKKILERLARMEHDRWVAEKRLDGWHYTEGAKNIAARLSPSLISWEQLPESEREKDRNAVRNIPQLLRWIATQDKQSTPTVA